MIRQITRLFLPMRRIQWQSWYYRRAGVLSWMCSLVVVVAAFACIKCRPWPRCGLIFHWSAICLQQRSPAPTLPFLMFSAVRTVKLIPFWNVLWTYSVTDNGTERLPSTCVRWLFGERSAISQQYCFIAGTCARWC